MKIGINHMLLPEADPVFYEQWWDSIKSWAKLIRVDTHMDAYAWRKDIFTVFSDGTSPIDKFMSLANRCTSDKIDIDFIRDGTPPATSSHWNTVGDWSSCLPPNTWREAKVPREAWASVNTWINNAAKILSQSGRMVRWQPNNEQFFRAKDQHTYARLRNIYIQPSYGHRWTSPVLWGKRDQLLQSIAEWETLHHYDAGVSRASYLAVNIYPDWTPGVTVDTASNVKRQVENLILVSDWASAQGYQLIIPEFGFHVNQVPEGEAKRVELTAFVIQCMKTLPIDSATLYWDSGDYNISNAGLAALAPQIASAPSAEHYAYVANLREQIVV